MAIYHLTLKTGSKIKGQRAVAKSNYIEREGKYKARDNDDLVLATGHKNLPKFANDKPVNFWKAADEFERSNARLFKELEFALPRELTLEQQKKLLDDFITDAFDNYHPMSYAIHAGKGENPHCHLVFTERFLDGHERTANQFFRRANKKTPEKGGALKADLSKKWWLLQTREKWAQQVNRALELHNQCDRVSHLSLEAQGIKRPPQMHRGVKVHNAMLAERQSSALEERIDRVGVREALIQNFEQIEKLESQLAGLEALQKNQFQNQPQKKGSDLMNFDLTSAKKAQRHKKAATNTMQIKEFPSIPRGAQGENLMRSIQAVVEAVERNEQPNANVLSYNLQYSTIESKRSQTLLNEFLNVAIERLGKIKTTLSESLSTAFKNKLNQPFRTQGLGRTR